MDGKPSTSSKVFALGEALLDLVYDGDKHFLAIPGGSVLNAAVSMSRAGMQVALISEYGNDNPGFILSNFLAENGVSSEFCQVTASRRTSLAIAFLDKQKNASYSFYHDFLEAIQLNKIPEITKEDYLLFGSFYSVRPDRRNVIMQIVSEASNAGSTIVFDPNIRKNHFIHSESMIKDFAWNMQNASIVKGSIEDFELLFGTRDKSEIYNIVCNYCKYLIITAGEEPLQLYTPSFQLAFDIPAITPVSTIGAGDNFNAGLIYGFNKVDVCHDNLSIIGENKWHIVIDFACKFAVKACLSEENFIGVDFVKTLQTENKFL